MNLKKNTIINLIVTTITNEGIGIGRYIEDNDKDLISTDKRDKENGFVVFVPFSVPGDELKVRILKVTTSHAYGKIEEIVKPSNDRVESDCKAFTLCGGCNLRQMSYEAELNAKSDFIKDAFLRIGKLEPQFLPIIPNTNNVNYRNKTQYPVGKNANGDIIYGFYRTFSHDIVPCAECKLQPTEFNEIADFIIDCVRELKVSVYNEKEHQGVLRHICIRKGHYTGQILVVLVARRKTPEFIKLAKQIKLKFPSVRGVVLNINKEKTNVILGKDELVLDGEPYIMDKMCGLDIRISSKSFYQVNTPAAEKLYAIVKDFAEPENKIILDLYCGVGTIGLSMANEAKEIVGVEIMEDAVKNAVLNAEANNINNAKFICADVQEAVAEFLEKGFRPDVIILDPSRKGCEGSMVSNVVSLNPEKIVMVSCNPVTAARDCKRFFELGYILEKVQGVDMFSRTPHVECVALMSKKSGF